MFRSRFTEKKDTAREPIMTEEDDLKEAFNKKGATSINA